MKAKHEGIEMKDWLRGLYLVTPNWDDTEKMLAVTEQALQGGAALVQYRHKSAEPGLRQHQAAALLALCRRYRRPLVINDFVDLCETLDADGVHVGGTDMAVAAVRAQLGAGKIVGASCYGELQLAREAQGAGASYVAFGGFYPSRVKKYPVTTPVGIIEAAKAEIGLPLVVIGGMNPTNAAVLAAAGADMVAAISSVYLAPEPLAAARQFGTLFDS